MGKAYDVAVIGAGAIGSSVAYFNAKKGASVVLIDAGDIAQSTSSRSDGNVLVCDKQPGFDALFAKASQDMFEGLSKELEVDGLYSFDEEETEHVWIMILNGNKEEVSS